VLTVFAPPLVILHVFTCSVLTACLLTRYFCLAATVDLFGGAIWGLDVSVQDTSFTGNSAGTDGGAVFVPPGGLLVVAGSSFEANAGSKISLCVVLASMHSLYYSTACDSCRAIAFSHHHSFAYCELLHKRLLLLYCSTALTLQPVSAEALSAAMQAPT
jgi:predicted outer membrane repeat protein